MALGFGFYGKLPSQGDFVSRRLPWDFTEAWDAWLQAGLAWVRADRGPAWLDDYLTAPIWRFALGPGVAGAGGWVGLWFPSVDRVGRHFPMTVAAAVPTGASAPDLLEDEAAWQALEDQALQALDPATTLERYDAALQQLSMPVGSAAQAMGQAPLRVVSLPPDADLQAVTHVVQGLGGAPVRLFSWGGDTVPPTVVQAPGLPAAAAFAGLLQGRWPESTGGA